MLRRPSEVVYVTHLAQELTCIYMQNNCQLLPVLAVRCEMKPGVPRGLHSCWDSTPLGSWCTQCWSTARMTSWHPSSGHFPTCVCKSPTNCSLQQGRGAGVEKYRDQKLNPALSPSVEPALPLSQLVILWLMFCPPGRTAH